MELVVLGFHFIEYLRFEYHIFAKLPVFLLVTEFGWSGS